MQTLLSFAPQLPPVRTASGRSPSPRVRWRLLEALYGYALTLRLFNGDWAPDPGSAADVLLAAAPFLGCATVNVDCGSGSMISPLTVKSLADSCMLWRMSQEVQSAGVKGEPALPSLWCTTYMRGHWGAEPKLNKLKPGHLGMQGPGGRGAAGDGS